MSREGRVLEKLYQRSYTAILNDLWNTINKYLHKIPFHRRFNYFNRRLHGRWRGWSSVKTSFYGTIITSDTESILEIGDHLFYSWRGKRIINLFKQGCTLPRTGKLQQVKCGNILQEPVTTS